MKYMYINIYTIYDYMTKLMTTLTQVMVVHNSMTYINSLFYWYRDRRVLKLNMEAERED